MSEHWFQKFMDGFKHAFAIEDFDGGFSEEDLALLDKAAGFVAKRRMTTPAVMFLESMRPLNFIGSQVMTFLQPILASFFSTEEFERLAKILEKRKSIGVLIERIEEKEHSVAAGGTT